MTIISTPRLGNLVLVAPSGYEWPLLPDSNWSPLPRVQFGHLGTHSLGAFLHIPGWTARDLGLYCQTRRGLGLRLTRGGCRFLRQCSFNMWGQQRLLRKAKGSQTMGLDDTMGLHVWTQHPGPLCRIHRTVLFLDRGLENSRTYTSLSGSGGAHRPLLCHLLHHGAEGRPRDLHHATPRPQPRIRAS